MTKNKFNKHLKEKLLESNPPAEIKCDIISDINILEYIGDSVDNCTKEKGIKISPFEKIGMTAGIFGAIKQCALVGVIP